MRIAIALAMAVAAASLAPVARAQASADPAARATARQLATEGIKLFNAGDYAGALAKLDAASALVPATTLGLRAARCLEKLGRLVEASERYVEVTRMTLEPGANPTLRKAQQDAVEERAKLLPRIPSVVVTVEGPRGDDLAVLLDDRPLPLALVGQKQPIDPGTHRVRARRADVEVAAIVTLQEGGSESVVLKLPPLAAKVPDVAPKPPPSSAQRTIGWAAIGAGAGLLALGAVHGGVALGMRSSLLGQCPDMKCPPSAQGQSSLYDLVRVIASIGIWGGAIGVAAGVPLVLTAPKPEPEPARVGLAIEPLPAGAAATLHGAF